MSFQFSFEVQSRADALGVHARQQTKQSRIHADLTSWFSSGGITVTVQVSQMISEERGLWQAR